MKRKANDSFGPEALAELDIEPPRKRSALDQVNTNPPPEEFRYGLFNQDAVDKLTRTYSESKP